MKIVDRKGIPTVNWSPSKDNGLTWRKVKEYCQQKIKDLENSKEFQEIQHYVATVSFLKRKIDNYNKRLLLYKRVYDAISLDDKDIDVPFVSKKGGDQGD